MKTQKILIAVLFAAALVATSCKNNDNAAADAAPVQETAAPVAKDPAAVAEPTMNAAEPVAKTEKKGGEKNESESEEANEANED